MFYINLDTLFKIYTFMLISEIQRYDKYKYTFSEYY